MIRLFLTILILIILSGCCSEYKIYRYVDMEKYIEASFNTEEEALSYIDKYKEFHDDYRIEKTVNFQ